MVSTQLDFRVFQQAVVQQFGTMTPHPLFSTVCDKDLLWQHYLGAFRRMGQSETFKKWAKAQVARLRGEEPIEDWVERLMQRENLLVEVQTGYGWVAENKCDEMS